MTPVFSRPEDEETYKVQLAYDNACKKLLRKHSGIKSDLKNFLLSSAILGATAVGFAVTREFDRSQVNVPAEVAEHQLFVGAKESLGYDSDDFKIHLYNAADGVSSSSPIKKLVRVEADMIGNKYASQIALVRQNLDQRIGELERSPAYLKYLSQIRNINEEFDPLVAFYSRFALGAGVLSLIGLGINGYVRDERMSNLVSKKMNSLYEILGKYRGPSKPEKVIK